MTVQSTVSRTDVVATAGATVVNLTFFFENNTDLRVYKNDVLQTTGFTIDGAGRDAPLGTVTFTTALDNGDRVAVIRIVPVTQLSDYELSGRFPSEVTEDALDKLTFIDQQQDEEISRCFKTSESSTITDVIISNPTDADVGKGMVVRGSEANGFSVGYSAENFDEVVDTIRQDVTRAETAATNAATSEANAASSATAASGSASSASTSETNAASSASAAATSATNAAGAEQTVIAQGNTQVARVITEGDTQVARLIQVGAPTKATEAQAIAGTDNVAFMTALRVAQARGVTGQWETLVADKAWRWPNGIIVQMDFQSVSGNAQSNYTLPVAFPNSFLGVVVSPDSTNPSDTNGNAAYGRPVNNSTVLLGNSLNIAVTVYYIAIGR